MKDNICIDRIQTLKFDLFVGMDVDKKNVAITIMDHQQIIKSQNIPYDPESIANYFSREYKRMKLAFVYEAGPTGWGLFDELTKKQFTCLVASPANLPAIPNSRVKTNRLDSIKLAEFLRGNQIKGVRVPSKPYRKLRHLIHIRDTFVKQATATKCRIKAALLMEGLPFPSESPESTWSRAILQQLKEDKKYAVIRFKLDRLIDTFEFTHKQRIAVQREIRRFCKEEAEIAESIRYMMSIPGIGQVIATEILAKIGDWRLLKNANELGAFLGLVPSESSTGETVRRGRITKAMGGRVRNKLIEGAWAAIRKDGELLEVFRKIHRRNPKSYGAMKAIVAVARKITCRIYRVLKDRRLYEIRFPVEKETIIGNKEKEHPALGEDSSNYRTKKYTLKRPSLVRT